MASQATASSRARAPHPDRPAEGRLGSLRRALGSIAAQILLLFFVATMAPLIVSVLQAHEQEQVAVNQRIASAASAARIAANEVASAVDSASQIRRTLARFPRFWEGT